MQIAPQVHPVVWFQPIRRRSTPSQDTTAFHLGAIEVSETTALIQQSSIDTLGDRVNLHSTFGHIFFLKEV